MGYRIRPVVYLVCKAVASNADNGRLEKRRVQVVENTQCGRGLLDPLQTCWNYYEWL